MQQDNHSNLVNLLNASGFLFQLAVEHQVVSSSSTHNWKVAVREHPWNHGLTNSEGFIDLVLSNGWTRLVIECKRPRDGVWVFLVPEEGRKPTLRARCWWGHHSPNQRDIAGVGDFRLWPESIESDICLIRGHGEDGKTMLERIGGNLIRSVEALAGEELKTLAHLGTKKAIVFVPIIITTAELKVCRMSPATISLAKGTLDDPQFETVPFIRFRKSLVTWSDCTATSLSQSNQNNQRTVFIINATSLSEALPNCSSDWPQEVGPFPWEAAREIRNRAAEK